MNRALVGLPGLAMLALLLTGCATTTTECTSDNIRAWYGANREAIARQIVYPEAAQEAGMKGSAEVRLTVNGDGRVTECQITRSSGNPLLDAAACNLKNGNYSPPGCNTGFQAKVPVRFELLDADDKPSHNGDSAPQPQAPH